MPKFDLRAASNEAAFFFSTWTHASGKPNIRHAPHDDSLTTCDPARINLRIKYCAWVWNHCRKKGGLIYAEGRSRFVKVVFRGRFSSIDSVTPFDNVQVELKYAPLVEFTFEEDSKDCLLSFAEKRTL